MRGMGRKNKIIVEYNLHISAAQPGQVAPVDTPASTRHKLTGQITLGSRLAVPTAMAELALSILQPLLVCIQPEDNKICKL